MLGSSIHTRLWLTYIFIIALVLLIAFAGIVIAFRRSPLLYRQVFYRISLINNFLKDKLSLLPEAQWNLAIRIFLEEIDYNDVHIAILNNRIEVLLESGNLSAANLPNIIDPADLVKKSEEKISIYRDDKRQDWFFQITEIIEGYYLLTAAPRPNISIRSFFQDELMKPLFRAGIYSSLIALVMGWFIAKWITQPLKRISNTAQRIAEGEYVEAPNEGPKEIRRLATTMNEMNRKVKSTLQSQQDFIANVSHEFKTPLTSIQGFAQAIYEDAVDTIKKRKDAARIIMNEAERLDSLVNELLTLAKMDAGTIQMKISEVDLNGIISNLLEKFQIQFEKADLKIKTKFDLSIKVFVDGERISLMISNLIDNAIKYSKKGDQITIRTREKDGFAVVEVSDSGIGISPEDQRRIFERFYQADKSRKGGLGRSVGLGLAIAHQIVAAHEGSIDVRSKMNQGTTFVVKLPVNHGDLERRTY